MQAIIQLLRTDEVLRTGWLPALRVCIGRWLVGVRDAGDGRQRTGSFGSYRGRPFGGRCGNFVDVGLQGFLSGRAVAFSGSFLRDEHPAEGRTRGLFIGNKVRRELGDGGVTEHLRDRGLDGAGYGSGNPRKALPVLTVIAQVHIQLHTFPKIPEDGADAGRKKADGAIAERCIDAAETDTAVRA